MWYADGYIIDNHGDLSFRSSSCVSVCSQKIDSLYWESYSSFTYVTIFEHAYKLQIWDTVIYIQPLQRLFRLCVLHTYEQGGTQGVRLPPPLWIFTSPPASLTKILPPLYLYNRAEFMILIWLLRTGKPWNPSSVESTTSAEDATHTLIFMIGNQGDFLAPASKHIIEYRFKPPTFLPQQPISKTSTYCILDFFAMVEENNKFDFL